MPRTPNGEFLLPPGQPVETDTVISSSVHNTLASDVADALTDSLSRTGKGGMLVPFRTINGTPQSPGFSFVSSHNTGMSYEPTLKNLQLSTQGVLVFSVTTEGTETIGKQIAESLHAYSEIEAAPDSTNHAITAGNSDGKSVKIGLDGIQASDAGAASVLELNKFGGEVRINDKPIFEDVFLKSEHITTSQGDDSRWKPIILNARGKVDMTMCECDALKLIGVHTPTPSAEYPDPTGVDAGGFWIISGLTATYTFQTGDLAGQTCDNGYTMLLADAGWALFRGSQNVDLYYRLDGFRSIIADFQAGGHRLVDVSDGTEDNHAATVSQIMNLGSIYLPVDGKARDSDLLDGRDSSDFADAVHSHDELYFTESEHISNSAGVDDANKPIVLNAHGHIDPSMIDASTFYFVGDFTPVDGAEYPDLTGHEVGAFWIVEGLSADYTFVGGDLAGKTIANGDFMVWGSAGWAIMAGEMDPVLYYRLDGSQPLTDPFAGGGQPIKNIADAVDDTDALTLGQANGLYIGDGDKASDSELLDGIDSTEFIQRDGSVMMAADLVFQHATEEFMFNTFNRLDGTKKAEIGVDGDTCVLRIYDPTGSSAIGELRLDNTGEVQISGGLQVASEAVLSGGAKSAVIPVDADDLTRKDYVDAHYLRGILPFDGTDRVFTTSEQGFWNLSGYSPDWIGVGYPAISGTQAWTEISIVGIYGFQRVWGYSAEPHYRRLSAGVWQPWTKIGGGANETKMVDFDGNNAVIRRQSGISSVTRLAEGRYALNFSPAFADANYIITGIAGGTGTHDDNTFLNLEDPAYKNANTCVVAAREVPNDDTVRRDCNNINVLTTHI